VGQPYAPKSIELRHGLVGATKITSGMCGVGAPKISENRFLFLQGSQTIRISRCRFLFNGCQMLFRPGVKRSSREADHSTAFSTEIKNVYPALPSMPA
jgi:hypothetical protein